MGGSTQGLNRGEINGYEGTTTIRPAITAEADDRTYVDMIRDESGHSEEEKSIQERTRRYLQRTHKSSTWFMINAMARTYTADEPSVRDALQGNERKLWWEAMSKEVNTLENMKCWKVVPRPTYVNMMHTKIVMKRKKYEQGAVGKHKPWLVVCRNKEKDCQNDTLSMVAHGFIIK